uniref:protein-ribulosamine 3-kinase n=1 Tax=Mus spicilegus TaxID=10103 RepID=A0A8C6GZA7_MUSSI
METLLKRELGCSSVKATGHSGGGCISQGQSYDTDKGRVFVKVNSKAEARRMFEGEMASLTAILKTGTVKVPKPIKVVDAPGGGSMLVMEHLDMRYLSSHATKLGTQLADLHLENKRLGERLLKEAGTVGKGGEQAERQYVDQFGFDVVTCCGYLPQVNDWQKNWVEFYARQRIQPQMDMVEKKSGDREALELWSALQARQMFEGEMASLEALRNTGLVRVPKPMKVIDLPGGGAVFVMEHLKMKSLSSQASKLGEQMADLHLYNQKLREKSKTRQNTVGCGAEDAEPQGVTKFGFHTVTCCGFIPQVNEWQDDWPTFFTRHRLQAQLDLIEKDYADRETQELWSGLQVKIPDLFVGIEIVPALLHGDLWSGNVAEDDQGPVIYDPASFYGHSEFELAIASMFGGFPRSFFTAYHRKIPKAPGFDKRLLLYQLFNYLNHWNHFGREYRSPSLGVMRKLLM